MRLLGSAVHTLLIACTLSLPVPRHDDGTTHASPQVLLPPNETTGLRNLSPQAKEVVVNQLKTDMVRAAQVGAVAQAVRLEQKLEDEILTTAVKKLAAHRGDNVKQAEDLRELRELVRRDKRAVELLSNVLGSSSGGDSGSGDGEEEEGGEGSNILDLLSGVLGSLSGSSSGTGGGSEDSNGGGSNIGSLITSLLGGSSGGGDGDGEGGGSNILSLLGPLSGSLSGGSSGGDGDGDGGDGGGSNILSLLTGLLGSSSGSSSGGGDGQDGGGGSNILTLLFNLIGGSSGAGGNNGATGSAGAGKDPLQGGTYDDLIGKGPFSSFGNKFSQLLMFKFSIFRTVFSLITSLLTSKSSAS